MLIFYALLAVVFVLGILSLRGGFRFRSHLLNNREATVTGYQPFVSVIAPCRGMEDGLERNLSALLHQDYPAYEVLFVVDSAADPAARVIHRLVESSDRARIIVSGSAEDSGQKVHNLRVAVKEVSAGSEVFVFADSDARPNEVWLRSLVAPLSEETVGASTGYRWFVPIEGGIASHVRAVWNASITSALGRDTKSNFCWGGSTAIRRATFERLNVLERWRGTVSDDFALTRTLQQNNLPIVFVPCCLVPAFDSCSITELFEFTNRQLKITRVYAPHLWRPVLIGSLLFCIAFFGGIVLMLAGASRSNATLIALSLAVIYLLGSLKSLVRLRAVQQVIDDSRATGWQHVAAHLLLWPITSALYLWNALVALVSRRIEWRGISYELKSADEAVIIRK